MSSNISAGVDLLSDRRPRIIAANISTWVLSVLAVSLRLLARWLARAGFWWDDWFVLFSLISSAIPSILSCAWDLRHGIGLHVWAAPTDSVPIFLKSLIVAEIFYVMTTVCIKLSILLSYRRIFRVDYVKTATTTVASVVFAWALACILIVCLQCIPLRGFWDKSVPAKCGVDEKNYFLGKSIPDTLTDLFILMIPLHPIWKLHTSSMQKWMLSFTFLLGGLVTIISIIRLVCLLQIDLNAEDITWNFVPYLIWTCVELNVGTIAACLPCLRPIYTRLRAKAAVSSDLDLNEVRSASRRRWQPFPEQDELSDQGSTRL